MADFDKEKAGAVKGKLMSYMGAVSCARVFVCVRERERMVR